MCQRIAIANSVGSSLQNWPELVSVSVCSSESIYKLYGEKDPSNFWTHGEPHRSESVGLCVGLSGPNSGVWGGSRDGIEPWGSIPACGSQAEVVQRPRARSWFTEPGGCNAR